MIGPRLRRVVALSAVGAAAGAVLVACGDDRSAIDYVIDARVSSYNANTVNGHADGSIMALSRVLPGFSIVGPDGQIIADRDVGTVTPKPGGAFTLRYEFTPAAAFSDGTPLACDDIVLAATALSGKTPGFDAATNAGYRNIATVDCKPGERGATVTFERGSDYSQWAALFGAGTLLPSRLVAKKAGVPNVVDPIRKGDKAAISKIAEAWNTGFALRPGTEIDEAAFPSSGPYKLSSYTVDGGLKLIANEKWWGVAPAAETVTVWPRGTNGKAALDGSKATVVDTEDLALGDSVAGRDAPSTPVNRTTLHDPAPLSVTQLMFASKGVAADPLVRRALASCMPRDTIARAYGASGQVWNLRTASPADPLGPALNVQYGRRFPRADVPRAKELLNQRLNDQGQRRANPTIRVGYLAPDTQSSGIVKQIANTCQSAGITVEDVSSPELTVTGLGKDFDVLLTSSGTFAAAGTASGLPDAFALYRGDPLNLSSFNDKQVSDAITGLAATTSASARLPLLRTVETAAWDALPSIPLFGTVRARESASVDGAVPGAWYFWNGMEYGSVDGRVSGSKVSLEENGPAGSIAVTNARAVAAIERHARLVPDFPSPGIAFKDLTPVLADADGLDAVVDALARACEGADMVAGIDARGFLLGGAVARQLGTGLIAVRKGGKLPPPVLGIDYELEYGTARLEIPADGIDLTGRRVAVIDDVLATGGTLVAAATLLEQAGAQVHIFAVIMELAGFTGRAAISSNISESVQVHTICEG